MGDGGYGVVPGGADANASSQGFMVLMIAGELILKPVMDSSVGIRDTNEGNIRSSLHQRYQCWRLEQFIHD